jgi:hypothetical protein
MTEILTAPEQPTTEVAPQTTAEDARYGRSQLELIWLRFVRNRAALVGGAVVVTAAAAAGGPPEVGRGRVGPVFAVYRAGWVALAAVTVISRSRLCTIP